MPQPRIIWGVLTLWAVLMGLSVVVPKMSYTDEIGLGAGLNRITLFFEFQFAALFAAVLLLVLSRRVTTPRLRWLARLPGLVQLAMVLALVSMLVWIQVTKPSGPAYTPPRPSDQTSPGS